MSAKKTFKAECFGEVLSKAEDLGLDVDQIEADMMAETNGRYTPDVADSLEAACLEHIEKCGYQIVYDDE